MEECCLAQGAAAPEKHAPLFAAWAAFEEQEGRCAFCGILQPHYWSASSRNDASHVDQCLY